MPGCMMDTSWPHSEEAYALGRALGDAMGWAYPLLLWAWGIDTKKRDGKAALDAFRLAEICRWKGDADVLFSAFITHKVIVHVRGKDGVFYIRGWKRNRRYFTEQARLAIVAENRRKTRDAARKEARVPHANDTRPALGNQYPFPYPSPFQKEGGDHALARGAPPPPIETTRDALAADIPARAAAELFEHYQAEMLRKHDVAKVLMPPLTSIEQARPVLVNAGGDMALAKTVVTALVESSHPYWVDRRRALWIIGNPRDFEQARLSARTASTSNKPKRDAVAEMRALTEEARARAAGEQGGGDAPA